MVRIAGCGKSSIVPTPLCTTGCPAPRPIRPACQSSRVRHLASFETDTKPTATDNGATHVNLKLVQPEFYFYALAKTRRPIDITLNDPSNDRHGHAPDLSFTNSDYEDGQAPEPNGRGHGGGGDDEEEEVAAATVLALPGAELEGLWESLVYEKDTKETLLGHSDATLAFSDASIDMNIITSNRQVRQSYVDCPK